MTFRLLPPTASISHGRPVNRGWRWVLASKDGPVAASPFDFQSEAEARSHIAKAKGSMKAARFAKVEVA